MDFQTLKSRLQAQIGRAPSDLCYELVTADINQSLRLHHMLAEVDLAAPYMLPEDFLEAQNVLVGDSVLLPAAEAVIGRANNQRAAEFTVTDNNLVLDVDETEVKLKYYARLPDLAGEGDTNTILTKVPSIYVYGVLAHHAALIRDPDALSIHMAAYERFMAATQREDNRKRMSGANMAIKARASA